MGGTPRCLFSYTYAPPTQGGGGGGLFQMPTTPLYAKRHAILRVTDCNSVLVLDQMASEAHKKRDASVSIHHHKAAHGSYCIMLYRQGNNIVV